VTLWRNAWLAVWRAKVLWLALVGLVGVLLPLAYVWLGLGVATGWQLFWHIMIAVVWLALAAFAVWWTRRRLGVLSLGVAWRRPEFLGAAAVAIVAALLLPYALVHWVPEFESFAAQAISAALRVTLAGVVFTGALLWLHACGVAASSADAAVEHGQDSR
jgi:hypothetical protein